MLNKMRYLLFMVIFLLKVFTCLGQGFHDITVTHKIDRNTTYEDAVYLATEEAKAMAIEQVCGTGVGYFSILKIADKKTTFFSKTTTNTYAMVRLFDKRIERTKKSVTVTIDGEICAPPVPSTFHVDVPKSTYVSTDDVTFNVSFFRDSYLKIFWFDEQTGEGGILYPQQKSFNERFIGDNRFINFPLYGDINYFKKICPEARTKDDLHEEWIRTGRISSGRKITKEDLPKPRGGGWHAQGEGNNHIEKNVVIVFVTTNSNVPYSFSDVNEEMFMDWWFGLPYSEKSIPVKKHITLKM